MDIRKLQRVIVDGLEGVKGQNIVVFNTEHLSSLFERVIIASGTSNRQTRALASGVRDAVKAGGFGVPRTEGEENGEWIIVDCGPAVVHVMQPAIRDYYHLEEIWGGKAVKLKMGEKGTGGLAKASEPMDLTPEPQRQSNGRRPASGRSQAGEGPGKPVRKAPGKVPAKSAAGKPASARSAAAKKPAAKKSAAPAAGARQPAARKTGSAGPAARKPAARKTPPRRPA